MAEADSGRQSLPTDNSLQSTSESRDGANHPDVKDKDSILSQLPDPVTTVWNHEDTVCQVKAQDALGQ